MHCILCYQELVIGINSRIQARKRLIFYYKTNGITFFKKLVDAKHIVICKNVSRRNNLLLKGKEERQPRKKRIIVSSGSILKFFSVKYSFKKSGCATKRSFRRL